MDETAPLGIVTGLEFEAAIVNRWRGALGATAPFVKAVGGRAEAAEAAARDMLDKGVQGLVSFGIAGALDSSLRAGTLVLPAHITDAHGTSHATDGGWCDRLAAKLVSSIQVSDALLVSVDKPVLHAAEKSDLMDATGARAVDMESLAVARIAAARDVPFIAIRAIADEAECDLPPAAQSAMAADGSISITRVMLSLIVNPTQIPGLLRLGRQSAKAKRTLARAAHAGLPWFALTG